MGRPKKYTEPFIRKEAVALLKYVKTAEIPFLQDFCSKRRYSSQRVSEFEKASPIFAEALKRFKDQQQFRLVQGALKGKFPYAFVIFTLKNVAGWRDVVEHAGDGKGIDNRIMVVNNSKGEVGIKTAQDTSVAQNRTEAVPV